MSDEVEVGDRVQVWYYPHLAVPPEPEGGERSVTGVLTDYRVGWLRVRPDEGDPVTVSFGDRVDRRYWRTVVRKVDER